MKKCLALVLAVLLAVSATACNAAAESLPTQAGASSSDGNVKEKTDESSRAEQESVKESPDGSQTSTESKTETTSSSPQQSEENKKQSSVESHVQSSVESHTQSSDESSAKPEEKNSAEESRQESVELKNTAETEAITLSASKVTIVLGDTYRLYATIHPSNAARTDFTWYWSDDSVISMNSDGVITAKAVGNATITAETHNRKTAVCEVTVVEKPTEVSAIPDDQPVEYSQAPELTGTTVGSDWFDDAIFVGDSVTNGLSFYADNGSLGDADFLCAVSLGYNNAMWALDNQYAVHPKYKGKKVLVEDGVHQSGKKKVFIMLGMNDIGGYGVDGTISAMKKLTERIIRKSPDVQIYVQSVTPLIKGIRRDDLLNNKNVAAFNEKAEEVCEERGFIFVNVAEGVSDSKGNLIYENCGDPDYMGLHFSNTGCSKWVAYLYDHVA